MIQVRLTTPFRLVVVAAPTYLARFGVPDRPEDLLRHECFTFRSPTNGAVYAWELEKGRRNWRVPVRGAVVTNYSQLRLSLAEQGAGLTYVFEPMASDRPWACAERAYTSDWSLVLRGQPVAELDPANTKRVWFRGELGLRYFPMRLGGRRL